VGRERNNTTDILRVRSKRKKKLYLKKKNVFVKEDYSINSKRLFFSVHLYKISNRLMILKTYFIFEPPFGLVFALSAAKLSSSQTTNKNA
jgi:hypothetical protein